MLRVTDESKAVYKRNKILFSTANFLLKNLT